MEVWRNSSLRVSTGLAVVFRCGTLLRSAAALCRGVPEINARTRVAGVFGGRHVFY